MPLCLLNKQLKKERTNCFVNEFSSLARSVAILAFNRRTFLFRLPERTDRHARTVRKKIKELLADELKWSSDDNLMRVLRFSIKAVMGKLADERTKVQLFRVSQFLR